MADFSELSKTKDQLVDDAMSDVNGFEKYVIDNLSGGLFSPLVGGEGGGIVTRELNKQNEEYKGGLQESQLAVQHLLYQVSDSEYDTQLAEIKKDTENAVSSAHLAGTVAAYGESALTVAAMGQSIKNFRAKSVLAKDGKVADTITDHWETKNTSGKVETRTKAFGIEDGKLKANVVEYGQHSNVVKITPKTVSNSMANMTGKFMNAMSSTGKGKIALTRNVISGTVGMSPLLATYGLEGIVNARCQESTLAETLTTISMMNAVGSGYQSLQENGVADQFSDMMKGYSDGYHSIEDLHNAGKLSEEEYNAKLDELNKQYQDNVTSIISSMSPEDQTKVQAWMDSVNNTPDYQLSEGVTDINNLDAASVYQMHGATAQQIAGHNALEEAAKAGYDYEQTKKNWGYTAALSSEEAKSAADTIAEAVNNYKYGTAKGEIGSFFKTLNSRIIKACPMVANIEAVVLKAVDFVTDKVMDLMTGNKHIASYEGMSIGDVADNLRLDGAKHLAITEGYENIRNTVDGAAYLSKDYGSVNAYDKYFEDIKSANSIAQVDSIVDTQGADNRITVVDFNKDSKGETIGITHEGIVDGNNGSNPYVNSSHSNENTQDNGNGQSEQSGQSGQSQTEGSVNQPADAQGKTDEQSKNDSYDYGK